jgi:hypothetical protein
VTAFARLAKDTQIVEAPSLRSTVGCGNVDIGSNRALGASRRNLLHHRIPDPSRDRVFDPKRVMECFVLIGMMCRAPHCGGASLAMKAVVFHFGKYASV